MKKMEIESNKFKDVEDPTSQDEIQTNYKEGENAFIPKMSRLGFIKKVYGILTCQLG